jgi:hypothetical protein
MDSWRDKDGYLLQSAFRQWMEGVVNKALNTLEKVKPNCSKIKFQDPNIGREMEYTVCVL